MHSLSIKQRIARIEEVFARAEKPLRYVWRDEFGDEWAGLSEAERERLLREHNVVFIGWLPAKDAPKGAEEHAT